MAVRTRVDLDQLPSYVPGRTVPGTIKLASNEVSDSPLPSVVRAIAQAAAAVNRYPDTGATELVGRLAQRLDVPTGQVTVGCGSVTLCAQLVQATCTAEDEVLFAWRSFEAYPVVVQVVGAGQRRVPLTDAHEHDLDAMLAAITPSTRMIFVCNPNNPTGTVVRQAELARFLDAVPPDVLVVLDEAYREYVTDTEVPDGVELMRRQAAKGRQNVAVLRTFSKAYGLAGLRVGYCIAAEQVIDAVRKVFIPFAVNAIAQVAAIASLDAEDELMARCRALVAERGRVRDGLLAAGYRVPESQANFVWLPLGEATAEFSEHCLDHKVVVRAFAGDGVRVTIGSPAENDVFLAAANTFRH